MLIRIIFLFFYLTCIHLFAGIYDSYELNIQKKDNYFMTNHFEEIVRFDSLSFNGDSLNSTSSKSLIEITKKIKSYQQNDKDIILTIIGHSYIKDRQKSIEVSEQYAKHIQSILVKNGIDSNLTVIEARGNYDPKHLHDKTLSNRVMLSMYVKENLDIDKDGVLNHLDDCPNTKAGVKVTKDGCKMATIIMLLDNKKEQNAIVVKTGAQEQLIDEANTFLSVSSKKEMSTVSKMSKEDIVALFGNVVTASEVKKHNFTLYFNNMTLLPSSQNQLNEMLTLLSKKNDFYIKISGHTDTKGSDINNYILSQKKS